MNDICALLNSDGGVLLFNCKKVYLEIRPIGESFIEESKEGYVKVIKDAVKKPAPSDLPLPAALKSAAAPAAEAPAEEAPAEGGEE